jgi:putative transposase
MEFAPKALKTGNFRELCRAYGISAKTGYKSREGFLDRGLGGMARRSRAGREVIPSN